MKNKKVFLKKSVILTFFSILTSFLLIAPSSAAYLIYSDEGNGKFTFPTRNMDCQKIYETIDQLSWPNNLNELKKIDIRNLPEYVTSRKPGAEREYIEHVLRQENDNIRLLWVPTTLFHLATMLSPEFCSNFDKLDLRSRLPKDIELLFYFNLNKLLLENLPSNYEDLLDNAIQHQKWDHYINSLHETYAKITNFYKTSKLIEQLSRLDPKVLNEIFKLEAMCYLQNDFPLYRSSTPVYYRTNQPGTYKEALDTINLGTVTSTNTIIVVDPKFSGKAFGISIANTFFAGYRDSGACTFYIFTNKSACRSGKPNLYCFNVNKREYLEKYKDILYWPLSNPIIDLYESAERFHPRSAGKITTNPAFGRHIYKPKVMKIDESFFDVNRAKKIIRSNTLNDNSNIKDVMKSVILGQNPVENKDRLIQLLSQENIHLFNEISKEEMMEIFLDHNSELEVTYLMSHFIADYMKVIHDGEKIVEHQVTENQHPHNELYNNQLELGEMISNNCLKIWNEGKTNMIRRDIMRRHFESISL